MSSTHTKQLRLASRELLHLPAMALPLSRAPRCGLDLPTKVVFRYARGRRRRELALGSDADSGSFAPPPRMSEFLVPG